MNKVYKILLENQEIATTKFEKADAPMGVVNGILNFSNSNINYQFFKDYCVHNKIEIAMDYPEDKMISTFSIPNLKVLNQDGIEIKGVGNQICGMDNEEYEIEIFGIPYPFYEEEFPHHVADYKTMFDDK
ncbi:MAG: hypothetical protein ACSHXF_07730 [Aquaticitalea sp.]